jgi:hypothetical protein
VSGAVAISVCHRRTTSSMPAPSMIPTAQGKIGRPSRPPPDPRAAHVVRSSPGLRRSTARCRSVGWETTIWTRRVVDTRRTRSQSASSPKWEAAREDQSNLPPAASQHHPFFASTGVVQTSSSIAGGGTHRSMLLRCRLETGLCHAPLFRLHLSLRHSAEAQAPHPNWRIDQGAFQILVMWLIFPPVNCMT